MAIFKEMPVHAIRPRPGPSLSLNRYVNWSESALGNLASQKWAYFPLEVPTGLAQGMAMFVVYMLL